MDDALIDPTLEAKLELARMVNEGLIVVEDDEIVLTDLGREWLRING